MLGINLSNGSVNRGAAVTALQTGKLGDYFTLCCSGLEWERRDGFGTTIGSSQRFLKPLDLVWQIL